MKTAKQSPKKSLLNDPDVKHFRASEGFSKFIQHLESIHPVKQILAVGATEHLRSVHQLKCEQFEIIINELKALNIRDKQSRLESDYSEKTQGV